jgi:hypothetical protein
MTRGASTGVNNNDNIMTHNFHENIDYELKQYGER